MTYIYRLIDIKDGNCKYIGITEELENGILWNGLRIPELLSSKWQVEYQETSGVLDAKAKRAYYISRYQPAYNRSVEYSGLQDKKVEENISADQSQWKNYQNKVFDFAKSAGNLRNGSARMTILLLATMSGGMVTKDICVDVCKTKPYYKKVMNRMRQRQEAETVFGKTPHMLHILRAGCQAVQGVLPEAPELQKSNCLSRANPERKQDVSTTLYIMQLLGAELLPGRKPPLYDETIGFLTQDDGMYGYTPSEIKKLSLDELRRSRCTGILLLKDTVYLFYHMGDRNMKYPVVSELQACTLLQSFSGTKKVQQILLGKSDMLYKILENGRTKEKVANGGKNFERITPDLNMIFVPTDSYRMAALYLRLLLYGQERLEKLERFVREKDHTVSVSAIPLHLRTMAMLAAAREPVSVLCSETQEAFLRKISPAAITHAIKEEKLEDLLKE